MKTIFVKSLTAAALAGLLTGCIAPNGEPDNTGSGALIGGATGAIIGASADRNSGAGALIGAAAGLIAGGLIGHSMDQQAQAEKQYSQPAYAPAPQQPPPSLADIKAMVRAGVSDDIIIAQISNSHAIYNLDANAIIDLNNAGVSQKVINFMINTAANGKTVVVSQAPPPPPVETVVVAPGPDYVWVGGEWAWNGGWVWVGGHWLLPPYPHAVWVGGRWDSGPHGWYRSPGHWR
jgi:surface antigen